jgi:hypothetical protein
MFFSSEPPASRMLGRGLGMKMFVAAARRQDQERTNG